MLSECHHDDNTSQESSAPALVASDDPDDPRAKLLVVQAKVAQVEQELRNLMDQTHTLQAQINGIYSPAIRLLPPEIAAEIFQACVPEFDMDSDMGATTSTPLVIGAVCTHWRRVAWSAPRLWSSLTLRLNTSNINTQISLLEEWLSRTGDLPLSLRLFSEEEIHWAAPTTPGTAIEVIRKYAPRWRDLDLRLPTSCYKYLPSSDESLPLLKSLNLNPPGGQGERRHKVDMSSSAKIQHLSLSCVYLISMKFQWVHVTHLRLEAFYVDECLEALRQSPQLETCSLRNIIGGDDGHALPEAPLVLPSLHTLSIENEKDTHIALLLDTIATPNMMRFSYSGRSLVHLPSLCALIARSAALEAITIEQTTISDDDAFKDLLRAMNSVKTLVFTTRSSHNGHSPLDDDILRMCNPALLAQGEKCLLPHLETLEYRGPQTFSWPVMMQTLESRVLKAAIDNTYAVTNDCGRSSEVAINTYEGSGEDTGRVVEPSAAPLQGSAEASEWQSVRLTLTHRNPDPPKLPVEEGLIERLKALATKVSVQITSIDTENKEVTFPLITF